MNQAMLKTRSIKTNWATKNQNQKREELDYDEVFRETETTNCTVYVGGIPANSQDAQMRRHFEDYGKITDVRIFPAKNYAFIRFESHAAAAKAIVKTNGSDLMGSTLKCWWGKEGPEGGNNRPHNNYNNSHHGGYNKDHSHGNMAPQQQQQYMQQYMQQYNPYYQQQYYQQMQQNGGGNPNAGGNYQQNGYQGYAQQNAGGNQGGDQQQQNGYQGYAQQNA